MRSNRAITNSQSPISNDQSPISEVLSDKKTRNFDRGTRSGKVEDWGDAVPAGDWQFGEGSTVLGRYHRAKIDASSG
jgi:hypothetical protein